MRAVHLRVALGLLGLCGAGLLGPAAQAQEWKTSGFASLVVGRSTGGCVADAGMAPSYQADCTRYIADWAHAGVYTQDWSAAQESRAGLQLSWAPTREWSATTQITARSRPDQHLNLEWAYLSYAPSPSWTLQVGRKRLPLYFYSDFQDIGYAYSTIRPSPDVYGWDVVNYNGLSAAWRTALGGWNLRLEGLYGGETSRKNPYSRLVTDETLDVRWSGIVGAVVELEQDWFSARLSYIRSDFQQGLHGQGWGELADGSMKGRQSFIGLALNADPGDWVLRSELGRSKRPSIGYDADFYLLTVGHRFGPWTPTVGLSQYKEKARVDAYAPLDTRSLLIALRYELNASSALKVQWDRVRERGPQPFAGNANALTASWDLVF
ncbi:hypothetical protein ACS5PK_03185 [Roseateles sp. DB2]|uniref:hypothetical protein n=1 Tax=Roseateles sp. DB2 TaxID=3453717 RepID=UPI003EF07A0F